MIINYHNHWVTATNIDTERSSVQISLVNTPVFLYDSFNDLSNLNCLQLTLSFMFPRLDKFVVHKAEILNRQISTNDCGLFALSYVKALCTGRLCAQ